MENKVFYCVFCEYSTKRKYDLIRHHKAKHIKENTKNHNEKNVVQNEKNVVQNEKNVVQNEKKDIQNEKNDIQNEIYICIKCNKNDYYLIKN